MKIGGKTNQVGANISYHLCYTKAMPEVMKRVVAIVLLDFQLHAKRVEGVRETVKTYQPASESNRIDVERVHKVQLIVHVFQ